MQIFKFHFIPSFVIAPHKETVKYKFCFSVMFLSRFSPKFHSHVVLLILVFLFLGAAF